MNTITFLGTGGARFVVARQQRASGGLWCSFEGKNILIDPGPGSLLHCLSRKPKLDPRSLDALILTHKHLDHANDINVLIEAMTDGGYTKKGTVFCPQDALDDDPVIYHYLRKHPEKIERLLPQQQYTIENLHFKTSSRMVHGVETYGLFFPMEKGSIGILSDTKYHKELLKQYNVDLLLINVVFFEQQEKFDHLSLPDVECIIAACKPKMTVLTHFGTTMLQAKPSEQAKRLSQELQAHVIAAYDGMTLNIDEINEKS